MLGAGHDLAWAVEGLGFTVVYSTTRPAHTREATKKWQTDQDFPEGRALLGRPASEFIEHTRKAWQIKLAHARAVTNRHPAWLRAFVDDDRNIVHRFVGLDVPAHAADDVVQLGVASLRQRLDSAVDGRGNLGSAGHRSARGSAASS